MSSQQKREPLIELRGIDKAFGEHVIFKDMHLEVYEGEALSILGESGTGKSLAIKMVVGLVEPDAGTVLFRGRNLSTLRRRELPQHRRQVAAVFQDHRLLLDRSVFDNVALPLRIAGFAEAEIGARVRSVLARLGLETLAGARPSTLSTGEQQRVGIARAVVGEPALLIADEPTGNLDPQLAQEVMELFASLPERGTTVLVASHDLYLIKRMRRRVLVLEQGCLIDDYRPESAP